MSANETPAIPYTLTRSRRRTLALQISSTAEVIVRAPRWTPQLVIRRFVDNHREWLHKTLTRVQSQQKVRQARQFLEGEIFPVWGEAHRLVFQTTASGESRWSLDPGQLLLNLPLTAREPSMVQKIVRAAYAKALTDRLQTLLPERARALGVTPKKFSVGFAQHRWGSCASSGILRFNGRLAMMPPAILEYVVAHELAHLRHMNHSPHFWALVERSFPNYAESRKWLRLQGASYLI